MNCIDCEHEAEGGTCQKCGRPLCAGCMAIQALCMDCNRARRLAAIERIEAGAADLRAAEGLPEKDAGKNPHAVAIGRLGSGKTRTLTPEDRARRRLAARVMAANRVAKQRAAKGLVR